MSWVLLSATVCGLLSHSNASAEKHGPIPGTELSNKIFANGFERAYPKALSIGHYSACARMSDSTLRCWGDNSGGQLGSMADGYYGIGHAVPVPLAGVVDVAIGGNHACAIMENGGVKCWGSNYAGQLGLGDDEPEGIHGPTDVPQLVSPGVTVKEIAVGTDHTCALLTSSIVKCWGLNQVQQSGQQNPQAPDNMYVTTPTEVNLAGATPTHIFAGEYHSCASTPTGTVCWGLNNGGQLGRTLPGGALWDMPGPSVPEIINPDSFISAASSDHACAVRPGRVHQCWGRFELGQLGDGTSDPGSLFEGRPTASTVLNDPGFDPFATGALNSCGIYNGAVWCWGDNSYQQLTEGAPFLTAVPFLTSITSGATQVAIGAGVVCAIVDSRVMCWGINDVGILGRDLRCGIDQDPNACWSPLPADVHGF